MRLKKCILDNKVMAQVQVNNSDFHMQYVCVFVNEFVSKKMLKNNCCISLLFTQTFQNMALAVKR